MAGLGVEYIRPSTHKQSLQWRIHGCELESKCLTTARHLFSLKAGASFCSFLEKMGNKCFKTVKEI